MADVKVTTQFDRSRGRMRLVFSEKIDYLEMSLDQAISLLTEVVNRCLANKMMQLGQYEKTYPPGHPMARSPWADEIEAAERKKK